SRRLIVAVYEGDQEISRGWHDEDVTSLEDLEKFYEMWEKVLEALGSPWKLMEDLETSCRRL
ncbi:hypothetical protein Tco_0244839, partial [Tanacetum coccineum]